MSDYGLKTSLNGIDIKTATLQQLAFSSSYPIFKIAFSGNLTINVTAGTSSTPSKNVVNFNHNLGYIPAFRCYCYVDSLQTQRQSLDVYSYFGQANNNSLVARMTTSQLILKLFNWNTTTYSLTVYYYIYADVGS